VGQSSAGPVKTIPPNHELDFRLNDAPMQN